MTHWSQLTYLCNYHFSIQHYWKTSDVTYCILAKLSIIVITRTNSTLVFQVPLKVQPGKVIWGWGIGQCCIHRMSLIVPTHPTLVLSLGVYVASQFHITIFVDLTGCRWMSLGNPLVGLVSCSLEGWRCCSHLWRWKRTTKFPIALMELFPPDVLEFSYRIGHIGFLQFSGFFSFSNIWSIYGQLCQARLPCDACSSV